jgi:uncharacterized membrane protein
MGVAFLYMIFYACTKQNGSPATTPVTNEPKFSRDIRPVISSKCAITGCHVANFPFGNFTLDGDFKARVDNGKVQSLVLENKIMPPAKAVPLTDSELEKLQSWINNGAEMD